jgi:hypothetical protein
VAADKRGRDRATKDLRAKLKFGIIVQRFDAQEDAGVLPGTAGLLLVGVFGVELVLVIVSR